jgi:hypothetical protein
MGVAPNDLHLATIDDDRVLLTASLDLDIGVKGAVVRVVFEQERAVLGRVWIADADVGNRQLIGVLLVQDLEYLSTNTAKAIDRHSYGHGLPPVSIDAVVYQTEETCRNA